MRYALAAYSVLALMFAPDFAQAQGVVGIPLSIPLPVSFNEPEGAISDIQRPTFDLAADNAGVWLVLTNTGTTATTVSAGLGFGESGFVLTQLVPNASYLAPLAVVAHFAGHVGQPEARLLLSSGAGQVTAQLLRVAPDGTISNISYDGCEMPPTSTRFFPHVFGIVDAHIAESQFVVANESNMTLPITFTLYDGQTGERVADWQGALFGNWSISLPASLLERAAPPQNRSGRYVVRADVLPEMSASVRVTHLVRRTGTVAWRDVSAVCLGANVGPGWKWIQTGFPLEKEMQQVLATAIRRQGYSSASGTFIRMADDTLRAGGADEEGRMWLLRIDPATYRILERRIPD